MHSDVGQTLSMDTSFKAELRQWVVTGPSGTIAIATPLYPKTEYRSGEHEFKIGITLEKSPEEPYAVHIEAENVSEVFPWIAIKDQMIILDNL